MPFARQIYIGFVLFFSALALVPAAGARSDAATLTLREQSLVAAVNDVRRSHGARPLQVDPRLVTAARSYSATMLRTGTFMHGALGARLARFGARGPLYGENLAWAVGPRAASRRIVDSWLASPSHRANLLRPGWRRIGVGALRGTFQGQTGATVVTADFAGT
jgi:uncharacterized protein YkwD